MSTKKQRRENKLNNKSIKDMFKRWYAFKNRKEYGDNEYPKRRRNRAIDKAYINKDRVFPMSIEKEMIRKSRNINLRAYIFHNLLLLKDNLTPSYRDYLRRIGHFKFK